ncbi:hypothetical protein EZV62_016016 [Acer yangbiense]|uniref:CCHC-type domain-containing protein n=1 Tax=Acer yangbiense TaxID=1000413 RepID=A0A5C7HMD5_9ROSI|nr:hypothetical protein EZV62_016016 [Acer yangbiense]
MKRKYKGNARVKRSILQAPRKEFKTLEMKTESKDIDVLLIDELQSSLIVHEQKFQKSSGEEQALKVTSEDRFGGRGQGRSGFRGGGRGRGCQAFDKTTVECYRCHKLGHFQYECPTLNKEANYAELDEEEEILLMSHVKLHKARCEDAWFLDSGCSNHMCGDKAMLYVFYVPELKNNLLSVGQLQEKGLKSKKLPVSMHQHKTFHIYGIAVGKQHIDSIPKKSQWRASQRLQLIHVDICGPITPISNNKKSMLMENFLRSKEFWSLVETSYVEPEARAAMTEAHRKRLEELKLKDLKVKNYLFQAIERTILETIIEKNTSKSKDIDVLLIDELQSSLIVHEQKFQKSSGEEQALKVTSEDRFGGRGQGRSGFRGGGRGRGCQAFDKTTVECYRCHKLGHFQYECPTLNKEANYAELDEEEEILLMSHVKLHKARCEDAWFLDSGCSNHMCGDKAMLYVFYVPELKNNLLSVGQLQEKGLKSKKLPVSMHQHKTFHIYGIAVGKQHIDSIPKKSQWRASQRLQLIHVDICGPITPISNNKKRCPTLAVKYMTPEETWSGVKPSVEQFPNLSPIFQLSTAFTF